MAIEKIAGFETGAGGPVQIHGQTRYCQSFTPGEDFKFDHISLRLGRSNENPAGTPWAYIYRDLSGGVPGPYPTYGRIGFQDAGAAAGSMPPSGGYLWINFDFSSYTPKIMSTDQICIVLYYPDGDINDSMYWYTHQLNSGSENPGYSPNNEAWQIQSWNDLSMQIWGTPSGMECYAVDQITSISSEPSLIGQYPPDPDPTPPHGGVPGAGKRIACIGDPSSHGGVIITHNGGGTVDAAGDIIAVSGAEHACPIMGHGVTSISAATIKTYHDGKLILTKDAVAGCGAIIIPPDRNVFVE